MVFPKACLTHPSSPVNTCNSNTSSSPVRLMSLPAILVGILVLVVVVPLQAQPLIPSGNSQNFEYKRYCSHSLSDVIRLICGGPYNSQQYAQYPQSSGTYSSNSLKRFYNDGGLVSECCRRPCGYSELKMYCEPI